MRCGVEHDSYQTSALAHVRAAVGDDHRHGRGGRRSSEFAAREPELARGLAAIRDEIRADRPLAERIRHKFEIKNTTGYRLVAFLDADEPLEIFRRLLVGSEGTLGFVSEAVFETVPFGRRTATAFVLFPSDRRRGGVRAAAGGGGRERDRADDGAVDEGGAGVRPDSAGVERGSRRRGRDPGRVSLGRRGELARARRARWRSWPAGRCCPAPALHARRGGDRGLLARARGPARAAREAAPAGDVADHRGRLRAARADRGGRRRRARSCWGARLPARRRGSRVRGQPALHADARRSPKRPTATATRRSCATWWT